MLLCAKRHYFHSRTYLPRCLLLLLTLQEFADVFPQDVPPGLPPIRGIEHQIDLIPGATQEEAFTVLKDNINKANKAKQEKK